MKVMVGGYVVRLAMFGNDEDVFLTITGAILTLLGLYKGRFGVNWGSLWETLKIILASFCGRFGVILTTS